MQTLQLFLLFQSWILCVSCFSSCQDLLTFVKFPDCCLWVCSSFTFLLMWGKEKKKVLTVEQMLAGMKTSFSIRKQQNLLHEANKTHKMVSFQFYMFDVNLYSYNV